MDVDAVDRIEFETKAVSAGSGPRVSFGGVRRGRSLMSAVDPSRARSAVPCRAQAGASASPCGCDALGAGRRGRPVP
jgi:hypothetical protein